MTPRPLISAIICTHNPRAAHLNAVLAALATQSLPREQWELIIVDSGSTPALTRRTDLHIPSDACILRLDQPGLALARKAGVEAAHSSLLASVDDDTAFDSRYLQTAVEFMEANSSVGICGGRFLPEFASRPPIWLNGFERLLAIRDLGPELIIVPALQSGERLHRFPDAAPIGVCVSRRTVCENYFRRWEGETTHTRLGRSGQSLASGEDNDFSLCCLEAGWALAYVPALHCRHLIPSERLDPSYLGKLNRASNRSWIQVLALHGLCPWPKIAGWTVPLRQLKAWFSYRAWAGPAESIRWQGACGHFEGRIKS